VRWPARDWASRWDTRRSRDLPRVAAVTSAPWRIGSSMLIAARIMRDASHPRTTRPAPRARAPALPAAEVLPIKTSRQHSSSDRSTGCACR